MVAVLASEFSGQYQHPLRQLANRLAKGRSAAEALAQTPGLVAWPVEGLLKIASETDCMVVF
ncbi:hypothetical protein Q31b_04580 [Novipirellula aureliae]|uniref:Uncharacterized protein n=1 Tax=Novipirellula aureliae TaxID=2527966 RepID=A0A5C6EBH1_9BACT|nr:hypothetical protein [Novipirellula aureliae]TWU45287.1 hypothetical protein Q31b_04580 [Novipirellula aureliae]